MDLEEAIAFIGQRKKWHWLMFCLVGLTYVPYTWHIMGTAFLSDPPPHHCSLPNGTDIETAIPKVKTGIGNEMEYSKCKIYTAVINSNYTGDKTSNCNQWDYEKEFGTTISSEWDLVCADQNMKSLAQSIFFFGIMVGLPITSYFSDIFGRKKMLLVSCLVQGVSGTVVAFVPNYTGFVIARFIVGVSAKGTGLLGLILVTEYFDSSHRTLPGISWEFFWVGAWLVLSGIAYLVRDWRNVQLIISVPSLFFVVYIWIIPESPQWLVAQGRIKDAEHVLERAAVLNDLQLPKNCLGKLMKDGEKCPADTYKMTPLDLFRTKNIRKHTLILMSLWLVNALVYYFLSLGLDKLRGDRYIKFLLSGLVELPSYVASFYAINRFGRRKSLALCHVLAGVFCTVSGLIPANIGGMDTTVLEIISAMIGKFFISASYAIVILYTAEIFPTVIRSLGVGCSAFLEDVGGVVAPYPEVLGMYWPPLPFMFFGGLSMLVGPLTLLLPETLHRPLPRTIEDGENLRYAKPVNPHDLLRERAKNNLLNPSCNNDKSGQTIDMNMPNDTEDLSPSSQRKPIIISESSV